MWVHKKVNIEETIKKITYTKKGKIRTQGNFFKKKLLKSLDGGVKDDSYEIKKLKSREALNQIKNGYRNPKILNLFHEIWEHDI